MKINSVQSYQSNFAGKYNNYNYITDPSGRFYAGMTLEQAKLDGTDKSFWRRDFSNLDKDANGVLSVEEIFKERNRAKTIYKVDAAVWGGFALWDSLTSSNHKLGFFLLDAVVVIGDLISVLNISKGNKRYERMMAENAEQKTTNS